MDWIAEIIRTASTLGLPAWQQFALILGLALLIVLGRAAWVHALIPFLHVLGKGWRPPPPGTISDGGESGPGVPLPTDPAQPGGGETGGEG